MSTNTTLPGGRLPYGYSAKNKMPVIILEEARIVKLIYQFALKGKTKREILYELNNNKTPSQSGKEFSSIIINRFFEKDRIMFYAGNSSRMPEYKPIIDMATAKKLIEKFTSEKKSRKHTHQYLLTKMDLLYCGYCHGKAASAILPSGKIQRNYYYCTTKQMYGAASGKCDEGKVVKQDDVNKKLLADIIIHAGNPNLETFFDAYKKKLDKEIKIESGAIDEQINTLLQKQYSASSEEQKNISEQISKLVGKRQTVIAPSNNLSSIREIRSAKTIGKLNMSEQRELIRKLIHRVNLFNDKIIIEYKFGLSASGNNKQTLEF